MAEQIASAHKRFSELAGSQVLSAVVRLGELYELAAAVNPRSTLNRPKDEAEREERQTRFNRICGEIGVLGDTLVAAGLATKTAGTALPSQYLCAIKTEAAKAVLTFFASDYGRGYLERLLALGIDPVAQEKAASATNGPLSGMTFVLTGTLSRPRSEIADQIKAAGGTVQESVTKHTRFLVAGDNVGATKISKARSLGTGVLDEAGLAALLTGSRPFEPEPAAPAKPAEPGAASPYRQQELF